jgi:hypothetical protein
MVEDHPILRIKTLKVLFLREIMEQEVIVWDNGTYTLTENSENVDNKRRLRRDVSRFYFKRS